MRVRSYYALLIFVVALCAPAMADDKPVFGALLNTTFGTHVEQASRQQFPTIPMPTLELRKRVGNRFDVYLESLPPMGPVQYQSNARMPLRGTHLAYMVSSLRYHIGNSPLTLGLGFTLFNQQTNYRREGYWATDHQVDESRVGGARYELTYRLPSFLGRSADFSIAATPSMHAAVHTVFSRVFPESSVSVTTPMLNQPETGSFIESQLRFTAPRRHYTLVYGVRYMNYVARFDNTRGLSDGNCLLMPFIGITSRTRP